MNHEKQNLIDSTLIDIAKLCENKIEIFKKYSDIAIAHKKRLSDDPSQYLAQIEAALVKMNRAQRNVKEAISHVEKAIEERSDHEHS